MRQDAFHRPQARKNLKDAQGKLILKNIRAVPEKLIRYAAHAGIKTNGNTIRRMEKSRHGDR